MTEPTEYVYGYGRTKHIKAPTNEARNNYRRYDGEDVGLCGAYGGHPTPDERPVCKRCEKIAANAEAQS